MGRYSKEWIFDLFGSDSPLCIMPGSKYALARKLIYEHIVQTQVVNVPANQFYPVKKYWRDFVLGTGLPEDNALFCMLWADINYFLVLNDQPEWLRERLRIALWQPYKLLRNETPEPTPVVAPTHPVRRKQTEKREKILLDLPPELC